jgi:4-hydroxy-tetrahydrodipicolinate synthase
LDFRGVFSVLPTTFIDGGELDLSSLRKTVELFVSAGIDGVTALGVTGEVSRVSDKERVLILETVASQVNGRVAIVAGTTTDALYTCVEHSRQAIAAGATAVMVSPPRMTKLNSESVVTHFARLASAINVPIVIQDYPASSGFSMEPSLLVRIAREVPSARTIKLEDPPTPLKIAKILALAPDENIQILGGLGGVFMLEELLAGAAGVMTGFAYPELLVKIFKLFDSGNLNEAADLFYNNIALLRFEFQEGIGISIRKEILRRRGSLADASTRHPGTALDNGTRKALDRLLVWTTNKEAFPWN